MKIDCRDLDCPKPVIEVKKVLQHMQNGQKLKVVLNSKIAKENVIKLVKSLGLDVQETSKNQDIVLKITKQTFCQAQSDDEKVIFLKDDKIGKGKLGGKLMIGFLNSIIEQENLPKQIVCVNRAVFLTTKNEQSVQILKEFEKKGVKIYSCGACLEHFALDLKVGEVGNAYSITQTLMQSNGVLSL